MDNILRIITEIMQSFGLVPIPKITSLGTSQFLVFAAVGTAALAAGFALRLQKTIVRMRPTAQGELSPHELDLLKAIPDGGLINAGYFFLISVLLALSSSVFEALGPRAPSPDSGNPPSNLLLDFAFLLAICTVFTVLCRVAFYGLIYRFLQRR